MTAEELRTGLAIHAPEMLAFLQEMKDDFGAKVLFVEAGPITAGTEPEAGVKPTTFLPASTWPYAVGKSPK